jgi:hypothetical protein
MVLFVKRIILLTLTVEEELGPQDLLTNEDIHVYVGVALCNLFTSAQLPYGAESERIAFKDDQSVWIAGVIDQ